MAISLKHTFESNKADGLDTTIVQPSNWNDEHVITMASGKILGRMATGTGVVQELPMVVDTTGQSLRIPEGTTAQRPAAPVNGMIRYNTTTGQLEAYQNGTWGNFSDTAMAAMPAATLKGRAFGAGTGAPGNLTMEQIQRLVYNIGNGYLTFNTTADPGFIFPYGQNLSRSTYSELYAKYGTRYGAGNGSSTFGMPDCRGRALVPMDNMGGSSAQRLRNLSGGVNGDVLGAVGGHEYHILTDAQMPSHNHTGNTGTESASHTHGFSITLQRYYGMNGSSSRTGWSRGDSPGSPNSDTVSGTTGGRSATHYHSFTTNTKGSDAYHNNVQPTIICNLQIYTGVY